jgi:hypothetical protein
VTYEAAELEDDGVADGVEDGVPVASACDEAGVVEQLKVLGDVGLGGVERVDQFIDGVLALLKLLKNAETEGLAEGTEAAGDELEGGFGRGKSRHVDNDYIAIW